MSEDGDRAGRRMAALCAALEDAGFSCEILDAREAGLELSTIIVALPEEDGGEPRYLSVTVLPDDGAMEQFDLVQAWLSLGPAREGDGERLARANPVAPLGHGAIREGEIHYRHVWPVPFAQDISPDMLEEWLSLFVFSADTVRDAIGP